MKIELHLGNNPNITIDITDKSITWTHTTRDAVTWAADIVSQISYMFPDYKLMTFDFSRKDDNPMTHLNGTVMRINAVWNI